MIVVLPGSLSATLIVGAAVVTKEAPLTATSLDGLRVRVVDDGDVNRMVAVGLLQMLGAEADAAAGVGDHGAQRLHHALTYTAGRSGVRR